MWPKDEEVFDGERMFGYAEEKNQSEPKAAPEVTPEQQLLNFLQRWPKDTVSAREIRQFGPRSTRDPQDAMNSAEVLVKHGWLSPIQSSRRDRREWQVVRRPLIRPTVAQP
jgi:hypothetical protein